MILVKPSFEIWAASGFADLPYSYDDPLPLIEAAARVCYKSEDKAWTVCPQCGGKLKVADPELEAREDVPPEHAWQPCPTCQGGNFPTSAHKMVDMLERKGHLAMLEHSWAVIVDNDEMMDELEFVTPFLFVSFFHPLVAGNLRAFKAAGIDVDEQAKASMEEITKGGRDGTLPELLAMTVKFVCDRGVSHELVRHRPASYAQESTRYCNYKGGVTFVLPPWVDVEPGEYGMREVRALAASSEADAENRWMIACRSAELGYLECLEKGWSPQQARSVLSNSLKTEIVVTASLAEWQHIFRLRCDKAAHPQMREIMLPLRDKACEMFPNVFGATETE